MRIQFVSVCSAFVYKLYAYAQHTHALKNGILTDAVHSDVVSILIDGLLIFPAVVNVIKLFYSPPGNAVAIYLT